MMVTRNFGLSALIGSIFVFSGCAESSSPDEMIIARVGDHKLTYSKIKDQFPDFNSEEDSLEWIRSVTKQWIDQEVLMLYAEKSGMVNERDIQNQLEFLKNQYISSMVKEKLLDQSKTKISDEQISQYYQSHMDEFINDKTMYRVIYLHAAEIKDAQNVLKDYRDLASWPHIVSAYNLINEEATDTLGKVLDESGLLALTNSKNPRSVNKLRKGQFFFYDVRSVEDKPIVMVLYVIEIYEKDKPLPLGMVSRNISSRILSTKQKELLQQKLDSLKRGTEIIINFK